MKAQHCEPRLAGFLAAIMANPDGPERLILADFLDDRDDPRAAILREPGKWRRRPKKTGIMGKPQALVWRPFAVPASIPPMGWTVIFQYTAPFPRCCEHTWGVIGVRMAGRPADCSWRGKWLCASCFSRARRADDLMIPVD